MLRGSVVSVVALVTLSAAAQVSSAPAKPATPKPLPKIIRISPTSSSDHEMPDIKLLRHGTRVVVHALITKTGDLTEIKFVQGNADLMPWVLKDLKMWKYKPYLYEGQPVEVESEIGVGFDIELRGD
jgi:hypothetical protein